MPWRDLPEWLGAWRKVRTRFGRRAEAGVWERIFEHLAEAADDEDAMIDSAVVARISTAPGQKGGIARPRPSARQGRPGHQDPRNRRRAR
jgi:transposase